MNERKVEVYLHERHVGTLAEAADHRVAFAYSDAWLEDGFAISPFSLPVEQKYMKRPLHWKRSITMCGREA